MGSTLTTIRSGDMKKKQRRKCRELDKKFGLAKGATEWYLSRTNGIIPNAKTKGGQNA